ncbi:hypothetical protein RJ55_00184 [Drechmeria coniospora]|nr:hypothetical protein RJ55_00184 [Drechmeria coniospora]
MSSSTGGHKTASSSTLGQKNPRQAKYGTAAAAGGDDSDEFTAEMRDRQARGKDPYKEDESSDFDDDDFDDDDDEEEDDDDDDDSGSDGLRRRAHRGRATTKVKGRGKGTRRMRIGRAFKSERLEDRERRAFALAVLDSPEQLMMYAQSTGDSIPSQRRRFCAMLAGFEPLPLLSSDNGNGSGSGRLGSKRPAAHPARDVRGKAKTSIGAGQESGDEWVD